MEVKIGIQHAPRELSFETSEEPDAVEQKVRAAVDEGGTLTMSDTKGRRILVPADRIAYVEIGGGVAGTVGFR